MARYETEDGEPRYGKRLSPEELEAYLYEQRVQSPAEPPPNSDWSSESRASSYGSSADEAREGHKKEGRENKEGSESDPFVRASGGSAVRLADPLPPVSESAALGYTGYTGFGTGFGMRPRTVRRPWRMSVIGLVLMLVVPLVLTFTALSIVFDSASGPGAPLGNAGTVYLEQGSTSALYTSTSGKSTTDCTVTGSDGSTVSLTPLTEELPYGSFDAPGTGTFTVTCPGGTDDVIIGPPLKPARLPLFQVLMLTVVASGVVGLGVTMVGAVRLLRYRAVERRMNAR